MLYNSTITTKTLQLLLELQQVKELKDFLLVGGTSLALQIGHRISIDLDLFSSSKVDISQIPNHIAHLGKIRIINQSPSVLNLFIDEIKVDFVSNQYGFFNPSVLEDNLKLASIPDIAAMKLSAITGRGSKKDFVDLFFILKIFSLTELFTFYKKKYPDGEEFLVFKSLTYFEDAEIEPMPRMVNPIEWDEIKNRIISEVRTLFP